MSSTFGSLNIAKTGLQYQQVAIDTANNNISNVNTDGYVRRRAVAAEVGGPGQPVMWSTYDGHGQGVTTQSVQRLSDVLMDKRVRAEHGNLSFLQVQQTAMERVEATINEPSDQGVATMLTAFNKSWQDANNAPDGEAARASVIAAGQSLAAAINTQDRGLASEVEQQQAAVTQNVSEINANAQKLAQLNHNIFLAQANGSDVSDLMDQRDQVALDLANKAGAVVEAQPDGRYTATIGGVYLVPKAGNGQGADVANMLVANDLDTSGDPDAGTSLTFDMFTVADPSADPLVPGDQVNLPTPAADPADPDTPNPVSITSGELGGESVLLNFTLKNYRGQLNDLATKLADIVNTQHTAGFDEAGQQGVDFFSFGTGTGGAAARLQVSDDIVGHPELVALASSVQYEADGVTPIPNTDSSNADAISQALLGKGTTVVPASAGSVNDMYQAMVAGLGSTVAGLNTQTTNQQLLTNQVDDEREQTVGVSLDEETINLMAAQRAYQASSRVLTVMNDILDTLINHMGV